MGPAGHFSHAARLRTGQLRAVVLSAGLKLGGAHSDRVVAHFLLGPALCLCACWSSIQATPVTNPDEGKGHRMQKNEGIVEMSSPKVSNDA